MSVQPDRRGQLAKVHIAKKQLGLEDGDYRAILLRVTGKNSSADCNFGQLEAVLAEFSRLGFVAEEKKLRPLSDKAYVRMIYGIWKDLKPYVRNHSHRALDAFVKRHAGVEAAEFLTPEDGNLVIEGLKAWLAREQAKANTARKDDKKPPRMRRKPAGMPPKK